MSKRSTSNARNLTLPIDFDSGKLSDLPLPEWVIECLGGTMAHIDPDDGSPRLYAARDWVHFVSGSKNKNISATWSKLKVKLLQELHHDDLKKPSPFSRVLTIQTTGGLQEMDFATAEELYQITIRMSDRSTTVRAVKQFLARSGVIVDNLRLSELAAPEKFSELRDQHIKFESVARAHMMQALDAAVWFIMQGWQYQEAADTVLLALYNRRSNVLAAELGLTNAYRIQLHQPIVALSYQAIAQEMAAIELGERAELNWDEARDIIYDTVRIISEQVQATSRAFKINVATGRRLLAGQNP